MYLDVGIICNLCPKGITNPNPKSIANLCEIWALGKTIGTGCSILMYP